MNDRDEFWMRRALAEARRGRGAVEPNPMVGAVLVRDETILSVGHHERFGGPHAEVIAIERAGEMSRGSTLYVSLEPCCHVGKTPPCTRAVIAAGIKRVVVAMSDPFPRVAGGGLHELREAVLDVEVGVLAKEAADLNAAYLKRVLTGRPYVTAKWAMTLDGRIATSSGSSQWISGERSRALVHEMRARMDAIVVGVGTVLADDPRLTARPPGPRQPVRLILDTMARTPLGAKVVQTAREVPTWVAVSSSAPGDRTEALRDQGCVILPFRDGRTIPIALLLQELGSRALTNVMIEGGGRVMGSFLDADEVDEISVFIAPKLEGGIPSHVPFLGAGAERMDLAHRLCRSDVCTLDGDIHVTGTFPHAWLPDALG